jgi:hypothetical protein
MLLAVGYDMSSAIAWGGLARTIESTNSQKVGFVGHGMALAFGASARPADVAALILLKPELPVRMHRVHGQLALGHSKPSVPLFREHRLRCAIAHSKPASHERGCQ